MRIGSNTFTVNRYKFLRINNITVRDFSNPNQLNPAQSDPFLYTLEDTDKSTIEPLRRKASGAATGRKTEGKRRAEGRNDSTERGESLKQLEEKSAVFFVRPGTMASASTVTMQRRPLSQSTAHTQAYRHAHALTHSTSSYLTSTYVLTER